MLLGILLVAVFILVAAYLIVGRRPKETEPQLPPAPPRRLAGVPDGPLLDWLVTEAVRQTGSPSVAEDPVARQRLEDAALKAVMEISIRQSAEINLPFLTATAAGPKHFQTKVTREHLDRLRRQAGSA